MPETHSRHMEIKLPGGSIRRITLPDQPTEEDMSHLVEEQFPDLVRKCYPRIYEPTRIAQYYSAKRLAIHLAAAVPAISVAPKRTNGHIGFLVASQIARFSVPTFFISSEIAQAIRHTTPPMDLEWHDMHLPFEAAVFMLPRGTLQHRTDGDCAYIAYARFKKNESFESPLTPNAVVGTPNGTFVVTATVAGETHHTFSYHKVWSFERATDLPFSHEPQPIIHLKDLDTEILSQPGHDDTPPEICPEGMTPDDYTFLIAAAHYVFGALLIMLNRPDLVEAGRLVKRVEKRGKSPREFWTANFIGARYRVARACEAVAAAGSSGSGISPRMHWRRGHWRLQPYGPNRSSRRDTWIEPMLINAD